MRGSSGRWAVFGCAFLLACRASGQAGETLLGRELAQLGATAESLDGALPSFTCKEMGTTEVRRGRKVLQHVSFSGTLQAQRIEGGPHQERFSLTELNGEPHTAAYAFPFYVSGGFDKGMRYFAPSLQACYRYKLRPGRIEFATVRNATEHPGCRDEGIKGFALLDTAGNVTHLERRVSERAADSFRLAPFIAIDFAPVELNGATFRVSQHMISEHAFERTRGRFEVTYSECRLFRVTVTLGEPTKAGSEPAAPVLTAPK